MWGRGFTRQRELNIKSFNLKSYVITSVCEDNNTSLVIGTRASEIVEISNY